MPDAFLHPFSMAAKAESDFVNIVRADGSTLWDDQGRDYIDGLASLWPRRPLHKAQNPTAVLQEDRHRFSPLDEVNTVIPLPEVGRER